MTVLVNPDTPAPRCTQVQPEQALRVVNTTDALDQPGRTVVVRFADRRPATLAVGESIVYATPFGRYLARGVHHVHLSAYPGSGGAEIYLRQAMTVTD